MTLTEELLKKYKKDCKVFIETGSHFGNGVACAVAAEFNLIYSIEFYDKWYKHCKSRFENKHNIEIIQGDSSIELDNILNKIECQVLFFLDAHFDPYHIDSDHPIPIAAACPLMLELEQIRKHKIKNHTIMIDDRRIFTGDNPHWNNISEDDIISKLKEINVSYKISYEDSIGYEKDIIIAEIGE